MKKTFEGGEAMTRTEQALTPAGRVSQQSTSQAGGEAMRRFVWSTIDAAGKLVPFIMLECDADTAREIIEKRGYENKWMLIAEKLHEKDPERFPAWFDEYGRRSLFWYNNVLEDWGEAYERLVEEWKKQLDEYYKEGEEEALEIEAKERVEEELARLPVYVIEKQIQEGGGVMREWEVRFISYDYTADEQGERLWKYLSELPEPEFILGLQEYCDCGDYIRHNNGGHYHYWWRVYKLDDEYYLLYLNNSREAFNPWEQGFVYITNGDTEYSIWTETISEASAFVCKRDEILEEVKRILENAYISAGSLENIV
jgi:hypothetical protein